MRGGDIWEFGEVCVLMYMEFNNFNGIVGCDLLSFWFCCGSTLSFTTHSSYMRIGIREYEGD